MRELLSQARNLRAGGSVTDFLRVIFSSRCHLRFLPRTHSGYSRNLIWSRSWHSHQSTFLDSTAGKLLMKKGCYHTHRHSFDPEVRGPATSSGERGAVVRVFESPLPPECPPSAAKQKCRAPVCSLNPIALATCYAHLHSKG